MTVIHEPRHCCHCGKLTNDAVVVARATSSGTGRAVYACPEHARNYRTDEGRRT
ncbi:hypothetical protein [Streptomyces fractus]|uniref:hypothetical protein n=1 Tax=Streptomyces fractus TaxID=641806 RepID=UPI003CF5CA66